MYLKGVIFTFHNVSINTCLRTRSEWYYSNLHSTMFLLILPLPTHRCRVHRYLHSTMFLLIPIDQPLSAFSFLKFTFHNVSINTRLTTRSTAWLLNLHSTMFLLILLQDSRVRWQVLYLHSTMFLLIQHVENGRRNTVNEFTFHNVSINTCEPGIGV